MQESIVEMILELRREVEDLKERVRLLEKNDKEESRLDGSEQEDAHSYPGFQ